MIPFLPSMIVDLTARKTSVFNAYYSKALDDARLLTTPYLASKTTPDLYSAAIAQSL